MPWPASEKWTSSYVRMGWWQEQRRAWRRVPPCRRVCGIVGRALSGCLVPSSEDGGLTGAPPGDRRLESDEFRLMKGLPLGLAVLVAVLCSVVMAASGSCTAEFRVRHGIRATRLVHEGRAGAARDPRRRVRADDARAARLLQNASLEPSPREVRLFLRTPASKALKRAA